MAFNSAPGKYLVDSVSLTSLLLTWLWASMLRSGLSCCGFPCVKPTGSPTCIPTWTVLLSVDSNGLEGSLKISRRKMKHSTCHLYEKSNRRCALGRRKIACQHVCWVPAEMLIQRKLRWLMLHLHPSRLGFIRSVADHLLVSSKGLWSCRRSLQLSRCFSVLFPHFWTLMSGLFSVR